MTSAWSLSIKTVGRRRFHSAAAPPPPCATKDHEDDGIKLFNSSSNDSSPSDDNHDIHSRSHQLHQHQHQPHHHQQHPNDHHHNNNHHSDASESNFTIIVHPDDPLYSLHEKIQLVTGLKAEEQRLIYRGRIINCTASTSSGANTASSNSADRSNGGSSLQQHHHYHSEQNPSTSSASASTTGTPTSTELCVKDVTGLCDKQTIHLVPRIIANNNSSSSSNANNQRNSTTISTSSTTNTTGDEEAEFAERLLLGTNAGGGGGGGGGILGALLGGGINHTTTTTTATTATTTAPSTTSASVASLSGEAGLSLLAALLGVSSSSASPTTTTAATSAGLAEGGDTNTNASATLAGGGGGEGIVVLGGNDDGTGFDTTTINGLGALGGLFSGMGIPMGEGVGIATGADAAVATTTSSANDANAAATTTTADRTSLGYARPRLRPANTSSTRRIRRNAIPSSSISSSTLNSSLAAARATAARLTEADIRLPDPGSVEPVRQGLLTLHTLLGNALPSSSDNRRMTTSSTVEGEEGAEELLLPPQPSVRSPSVRSPLDSHRQWYRGQWLDVLDTVHQWLEATVVDIVLPSDILPDLDADRHLGENGVSRRRTTTTLRRSPPDAVVSANDLEGRRRLLLELVPRDDDDDDDDEDKNENDDESDSSPVTQSRRRNRTSQLLPSPDEGYYYRPRPENHNVQLLLIHYNGWPHRWDEWIRSDSERIRPFRTRTRHRMTTSLAAGTAYGGTAGGTANNILACPTPQAIFSASPSTAITDDDDDVVSERSGMLVELSRVVQGVNDLLSSAASAAAHSSPASGVDSLSTESPHLPWRTTNNGVEGGGTRAASPSATISSNQHTRLDRAQLRQLAPLLDRLGRTLTDAAPHIAALADSLPHQPVRQSHYASVGIDATSDNHLNATVSSQSAADDEEADPFQLLAARASHLYFGIGDSNTEDNSQVHGQEDLVHEETRSIIDPDLTDFVNGMVNTTRNLGGVGSGRNSQRDGSNGDQTGSSLLASYLASMGGTAGAGFADTNRFAAGTHSIGNDNNPRVIRMGGGGSGSGGGPGIDIHIHAIVTGPGMGVFGGMGGFPFDNVGVGATTPTASPRNNQHNQFFHRASPAVASPTENNDDADLFSELYSESPDPVNLHGEDNSHGEEIDRDGFDGSDLGHLFEECLSIEEEASFDNDEDDNDDEDKAAENKDDANDDSINGSMLSLSEIESHGNTSEISPALTASASSVSLVPNVPPISVMQADVIGSNENLGVPALRRSSPSLGNRLFRRTFGRLSLPSRRSSERDSRRG
ncbi:hypothetical protein ACHAWU_007066 [Discostella pseudostelligera]|uniref:Ubiquitin-like domain-containing protein n=1 Tax=Discostella pseudostelligera TaxID=259834 RepID=A0ABD3NAX5_9STRA